MSVWKALRHQFKYFPSDFLLPAGLLVILSGVNPASCMLCCRLVCTHIVLVGAMYMNFIL